MRYEKAARHRAPNEIWDHEAGDAVFGRMIPRLWDTEQARNSSGLHPELQKLAYGTLPELDDNSGNDDVGNEIDA
jgi:hypothetical protein